MFLTTIAYMKIKIFHWVGGKFTESPPNFDTMCGKNSDEPG